MKKFLPIIIRGAILTFLVIVLIVLAILKNNPEVCEVVTRGFSRAYGLVMSKITGWIPFSMTELTFLTMFFGIVALLVFGIINIVKKKYVTAISRAIEIAGIIIFSLNMYYLSCEFAYNRKVMPIPYYEEKVLNSEHVAIFNYYADDVNLCISELEFEETGEVKTNMSLQDLASEVEKAYSILDGNDYYASHFGGAKPMLSSFIYREFQITGVTYSPLAEANINILNTKTGLPLTVAHELAHTKGVMREDDANKLAFYICINSDSPYLRYSAYSAYFSQVYVMISDDYIDEEEKGNIHKIDAMFSKTRNYEWEYWSKHDLLGDIGDWFNDLYIKMSGVKEGTASYQGGSEYIEDHEKKELTPSDYQKLLFEKYYRS